ncbi:MAG: hypothetical protein ABIT71_20355 [Vicinamibacteraceae bacterium]
MARINEPGASGAHPGPDEHSHVSPGGEVHGRGVRDESVEVHHEVTDIPLAGTTRAAAMFVVFIGVVMLLMWGVWGFFLSQIRQGDPGKPAMSADDYGKRLPPTPRLQSVPGTDLAAYRAEQAAKLDGLAWVDQTAGTVRMPIGGAMRLIVTRADAFADQRAKAPADHSWAFPGAAMMDRVNDAAAPSLPEHSPSPVPAHGTAEKPQQGTTAPSEQDKPHAPAPPQH